jgi:hypothetical protein
MHPDYSPWSYDWGFLLEFFGSSGLVAHSKNEELVDAP